VDEAAAAVGLVPVRGVAEDDEVALVAGLAGHVEAVLGAVVREDEGAGRGLLLGHAGDRRDGQRARRVVGLKARLDQPGGIEVVRLDAVEALEYGALGVAEADAEA